MFPDVLCKDTVEESAYFKEGWSVVWSVLTGSSIALYVQCINLYLHMYMNVSGPENIIHVAAENTFHNVFCKQIIAYLLFQFFNHIIESIHITLGI